MKCPQVYRAINEVSAEVAALGVPKAHLNPQDGYHFRSIDDVLNRLAPILAKHKLCVLPRALDRTLVERKGEPDLLLLAVTLKVAFDLVSGEDGSTHTVEAFGEALDGGDKGTAKAMSAAYKAAMVQTFCIPISGQIDAEGNSQKLKRKPEVEPVQGWEQWCRDIIDMISVCESIEALDRVQDRNRTLLNSIKRERPQLYSGLGKAFNDRRAALLGRSDRITARVQERAARVPPEPKTRTRKTPGKRTPEEEAAHA